MKKLFFLKPNLKVRISFLIVCLPLFAFSQEYSVKNIPEELMQETDLVVRKHTRDYEVINKGEGKQYVVRAITLLNAKAKKYRSLAVGYDDMRKIESIELKIYDSRGFLVEKYKEKDFDDLASYDGFSVFSDNRLKALSVSYNRYPFTIEYSYEIAYDGLMFYPSHTFNSTSAAVEESTFSISIPHNLDFRYNLKNANEPVLKINQLTKKYIWSFRNLSKIEREPYAPSISEQFIQVDTSPIEFEFGGFTGRMDTWEGLAEFQRKLYSPLDPLPQEKIEFVKQLTSDAESSNEKIQLVYDYLQNNFRYVSVQLGIGGWQPFSPAFVDEIGYGDCKALSYYTKTMLEAIDIKANYTLISAGNPFNPIDPKFPTSNFNHVVLCVPNQGDTVWLECTSQTNPMGYSGYFTGNRKALMITDTDGVVVNTPKYKLKENQQLRVSSAIIQNNGTVSLNVRTKYTGLQFENDDLNIVINQSDDDKKEWLYETIDLPGFDIQSYQFYQKRLKIPEATVEVKLTTDKIASKTGSRLIVEGNLLNKFRIVPPKVEDRISDVMLRVPFFDSDSTWFEIPVESEIEYLPAEVHIKTAFGVYKSGYKTIDNKILYYRNLEMNSGRFPPEMYEDFRAFRKEIHEADNQKFIIKFLTE